MESLTSFLVQDQDGDLETDGESVFLKDFLTHREAANKAEAIKKSHHEEKNKNTVFSSSFTMCAWFKDKGVLLL